jgi:helix-turn-helix protein
VKTLLSGKLQVPFISKIEPSTATRDKETIILYGEDFNETFYVKVGDVIFPHTIISDREMVVQIVEQLPPKSYTVLAYCKVPDHPMHSYANIITVMKPPIYTIE